MPDPGTSPGSRRWADFAEAGETPLLAGEVRRTLDGLASAAPARIASGRSTKAEAEAVVFLWLAVARDLEADAPGADVAARLRELRVETGIAWSDKVEALAREIAARRARYPDDVARGRLTAVQAREQLERLEAVHHLYSRLGYAFDGTIDELRALAAAQLDAIEQEQAAPAKSARS